MSVESNTITYARASWDGVHATDSVFRTSAVGASVPTSNLPASECPFVVGSECAGFSASAGVIGEINFL